MDFTLSEPDFGSACGNRSELWLLLLLAMLLASPLLLWLRGSAHDSRDVLHAEPALPVSRGRHLLDVAAWALPAAIILLPLLAGLKLLYAFLFLDPVALMGIPAAPESVGPTGLDLLPRDGVIAVLAHGACLVLRRQLRRSEPDVLSLHARA
jgi:hypothetical protein